ncbi:hypothetical protein ACIQU7_23765 [Streptomyces albidoflavus]
MPEDRSAAEAGHPPDAAGHALTPPDEARLARAETLHVMVTHVLAETVAPDEDNLIVDALALARLAEQQMEQAVIQRREQGDSWSTIAELAGVNRETARTRWGPAVATWMWRERKTSGSPDRTAARLDEWYAEHLPSTRAVSSRLPSLTDPAARHAATSDRAEAAELTMKLAEHPERTKEAFNACVAAIGSPEHADRRRQWAALHLEAAHWYERLAALEPPLAVEHRRRAATQRTHAQDIAAGRETAEKAPPA